VIGDPHIELRDVWKSFGGQAVLRGVSLRVSQGECYTLLGGSGTGKSVSLKHMIGLLRPDRGRVFIEGRDVTDLDERDWVDLRTHIGFVFQGAALFDSQSVAENIAYPLREHRRWAEERIRERVEACLEAVGLSGIGSAMPAELSGGMRKRVGVARAIALEPGAILYDEPTTGLDPANSRRIGELIRDLQRRLRVTSVVVTHDLPLCYAVSDRVGLLDEGRLVMEGSVDDFRNSTVPAVGAFTGDRDPTATDGSEAQEGRTLGT
jgi:phospholipid/cholesterol/gamma-HCH transport system ATP-binding protein